MKAVTFFAPYGGAGRTTAAMAIASANVEMGRRVHILEVVDQLSSEVRNPGEYDSWTKATCTSPDQYLPRVEQIGHEPDLAAVLVDLRKDGIDLVLIDTPPRESAISNTALEVSDLVVVPISKSISEITGNGWLSRLWVRANDWDPWLKEFGHAITQEPAAKRLGVSPSTFTQLVASGFLEPVAEVQDMADRYLPEAIDELLVDATGYAKPVSVAPNDLVPLNAVQSFCKAKMTEVLSLLINHQLESVVRLEGNTGLNGIFVSKQEVLDQLEGPPLEGLGSDKVRRYLRINALTVPWLAKKRVLKPERVLHPRTKKLVHLYRHAEIDRFLEAYETAGRLAKRLNLSPQKTVAMLKQEGLDPLRVKQNMSAIFLRNRLPIQYL